MPKRKLVKVCVAKEKEGVLNKVVGHGQSGQTGGSHMKLIYGSNKVVRNKQQQANEGKHKQQPANESKNKQQANES